MTIAAEPTTIDPAIGVNVHEYLASLLTTCNLNDGIFIKTTAQIDNGYIRVEIRRVNFDGEDAVTTQLLHPVEPVSPVQA